MIGHLVCVFVLFFVTTRHFSGPESKFHFSFLVLGWSGDMSRTETELRPKWIRGDDLLEGPLGWWRSRTVVGTAPP